jgi:hypothetical protein
MPQDSRGAWLFDYEKEMDQDCIALILKIQNYIIELQHKMPTLSVKAKKKIQNEINEFEKSLNELRKGLVYVSYASTLDNVHALGLNVIKTFKRSLSDFEFATSVLSRKINQVEKSFYPQLDDDKHGYDAGNHDYMDSLVLDFRKEVKKDCRWDADLIAGQPLDISLDYNAAINSVVIGQEQGQTFKLINALYVLGKDKLRLKDLCKELDRYYSPHKHICNVINYYYDHTAVGTDASRLYSFSDEVKQELAALGWVVNPIYIGQASSHHSRFLFWGQLLAEDNPKLPLFRYNRSNCAVAINSMNNAGVIIGKGGYQKDKKPERDPNVKPEDATHFSEATDTLLYGKYATRLRDQPEFHDNITITL